MKFALIIPDGAADEPQSAADGLTPLQVARLPSMDSIVRQGVLGRANHVPLELPSGSDVGMMSLMGYDPLAIQTGRAAIEAAAHGIELGDEDWAIRCNLVTITGGVLESYTAGHVDNDEAVRLIDCLQRDVGDESPWQFHAGVGYRNLLVFRSEPGESAAGLSIETQTTPPHDTIKMPVSGRLPSGPGAPVLRDLMDRSRQVLARANSDSRATQAWLCGLGQRPSLAPFLDQYGKTGAVVTAVDLVRGLGRLLGMSVIEVDGATGYMDTDYEAKGRAAIAALVDHDLVVVHVEATDEASHDGDMSGKIEALERIDEFIVGPIHDHLARSGGYRILVSPDHPTLLRTRAHAHGTVPIAACGTGLSPGGDLHYDDITASGSSLVFDRGSDLMSWWLATD
ncbi:MAG: cofactor-independent phosphoglycerate mutase [Planctomycetota bacterium]|nr:cofactor-independent phosphoglycerate mutase [Planctomycetota bacterium]